MRDIKTELTTLPALPAEHDQLDQLAEFLYELRDILQNNPTIEGALEAGVEESRIIHAAVELKMQGIKLSYVWYKIHPLMLNGGWRTNFMSVPELAKHLGKECLRRETVQTAGTKYRELKYRMGETPSSFAVRLVKQHATASMDAEFQRRHPFYGVPADFVNALPSNLTILLKNGLRYSKVRWQSRHLQAAGVTHPIEIQRVLTKVCEELDTQLAVQIAVRRPSLSNADIDRKPTFWRRKSVAFAMQDVDDTDQPSYGPPDSALVVGETNVPTTSGIKQGERKPVGPIGPAVTQEARQAKFLTRRNTRNNARLQARWSARKLVNSESKERHIPGNPAYTGCYNCGSLKHLARECTAPLKERVLLIEEDPESLNDYEEACMYVMQGVHPDLDEPFETDIDTDTVQDTACAFVLNHHMNSEEGSN